MKLFTQLLSSDDFNALLYLLGVFKIGEFSLKAHRDGWPDMAKSPFFIDLRTEQFDGPLTDLTARWIGQQMGLGYLHRAFEPGSGLPSVADVGFIAGIPRAGTALGLGFHDAFIDNGWDVAWLEIIKPENAKSGEITITGDVGALKKRRGIFVDDVITNADSKFKMRAVALQLELEAMAFAIALDREAGGAKEMADAGLPLYSRTGLTSELSSLRSRGVVDEDFVKRALGYGAYMAEYQHTHPRVVPAA